VTTLFIGGDHRKLSHPVMAEFQDGKFDQVSVRALVIVPNMLVTAVCFIESKCENRFPHITLMTLQCGAKHSNTLLEQTCYHSQTFGEAYERCRNGEKLDIVLESNEIRIEKNVSTKAYFIGLPQEFRFEARATAFER